MESLNAEADTGASPLASSSRSITSTSTSASPRPYVSKVGVLPSSLPAYHKDYMEREKGGFEEAPPAPDAPEPTIHPRSQAEQEETIRRLKPHSRSQIRLDEASKRPQGLTPVHAPRKSKPVRWQFGIRSRNAPWEALVCIYKALNKLGCGWIPDEDYDKYHEGGDGDNKYVPVVHIDVVQSALTYPRYSDEEDYDSVPLQREKRLDSFSKYKLPADPWHIQVRWTTDSAVTSLPAACHANACLLGLRKGSHVHSADELVPDKIHVKTDENDVFQVVAMRMDIQIYEMEQGVYLVDFKCDGYETSGGQVLEEKDVTSPFPFLDMAARLIMQLADAD